MSCEVTALEAVAEVCRLEAEFNVATERIAELSGYPVALSAALTHVHQQGLELRAVQRQMSALREEVRVMREEMTRASKPNRRQDQPQEPKHRYSKILNA